MGSKVRLFDFAIRELNVGTDSISARPFASISREVHHHCPGCLIPENEIAEELMGIDLQKETGFGDH